MTVLQAFQLAVQHHRAGRLAEAEGLYRKVLAVQPRHEAALHQLGIVAHQTGRHDLAIGLIEQAIAFKPGNAPAYSDLGAVYRALGHMEAAIGAFRRAIALEPKCAAAFINLAEALTECGRVDEAIVAGQAAVDLQPGSAEAQSNLGIALAIALRLEEAVAALRRAIELNPDSADTHNNLASALLDLGRLDEAIVEIQRALALRPDHARACDNLGNALRGQGRVEEAATAYRRAIAAAPGCSRFHSSLLLALQLLPQLGEEELVEAQRTWNRAVSARVKRIGPHRNDRSPGRRLRLGYVSPDFRDGVVGRNLRPLFRCQDTERFAIACYSGVTREDELTNEFRSRAEVWRSTVGMTDEAVAEAIYQDGVDILVDLTQHAMGNRLPVFAHKPAPVQVSFMSYPGGTGLEAIEYRISDGWLEGVGEMEDGKWKMENDMATGAVALQIAVAERVCLVESFWCYDPVGVEVEVNALPASKSGYFTFGSLNHFSKVNDFTLRLWARVLKAAPDSRLVLLGDFGSHRERAVAVLEGEGVQKHRVEFVAPLPRREYLEAYRRIDATLDPFPYGGHTTSLDALWMGAPFVTLAGARPVSRAGLSMLNNLGLPEWVACSEDDYVKIATRLAGDLPRLEEWRRTLRSRMEASVLMDAPRFARNIEAAYGVMWRQYCMEHPMDT